MECERPGGEHARDSLEIGLELVAHGNPPEPPGWTVILALNVQCWCPLEHPDHGYHRVRTAEWTTAAPAATLAALDEALTHTAQWLRTFPDPDGWRHRHGLPPRTGRP
ncbi:hypothetical protein DPM19_11830 [Actinomadura craniellae]|uniref:Uncharacterized protein n=1 Tax=Actinomadura craniellae TaxID=2231787 RepID=A0A365H8I0_9ACTN|nr:hypothetical protein DPM19_11830 [Actinomadura craniellae]